MKELDIGKNKMRIKGIFVLAEHTVNGFGKPVQRGKLGQTIEEGEHRIRVTWG